MAQSSANLHNHNDMIIDQEEKLELLTKGSSSYYSSLFKNLSTENKSNAKILYEFLETEHNIQFMNQVLRNNSQKFKVKLFLMLNWIVIILKSIREYRLLPSKMA